MSLAFVFVLSSQILFGWEYAVLTGAFSVLVPQAIGRRPPLRALFNTGVYALAALASAFPMLFVGRPAHPRAAEVTLLCFAGGAVFVAVNILLVCLAVALFQGPAAAAAPGRQPEARRAGVPHHGLPRRARDRALARRPLSLVLLAGPLVTLTLYQRSLLASRIATRHAHTDSLTGLGNHRAYELELTSSLERSDGGRGRRCRSVSSTSMTSS